MVDVIDLIRLKGGLSTFLVCRNLFLYSNYLVSFVAFDLFDVRFSGAVGPMIVFHGATCTMIPHKSFFFDLNTLL